MKHSQWLRLKADSEALASLRASGDKIVMALRGKSYQCRKQTSRLSWTLRKGTISYNLSWLPAPVDEWSLLPKDATPEREQLLSQIHSILKSYRGGGRSPFLQPSPGETDVSQPLQVPSSSASIESARANLTAANGDRFWLQESYPWVIVRLLPNAQRYVVARFYSRAQADEHKRFLNRFMPASEFEVVFNAPSEVAQ